MAISIRTNEAANKEDFWNTHPVSLALYKSWSGITDNFVNFHASVIRGASRDKPLGYIYDAVLFSEMKLIDAEYREYAAEYAEHADLNEMEISEEIKNYLRRNSKAILQAKEAAVLEAGCVQSLKVALKRNKITLAEFAEVYSWRGGESLFGLDEDGRPLEYSKMAG